MAPIVSFAHKNYSEVQHEQIIITHDVNEKEKGQMGRLFQSVNEIKIKMHTTKELTWEQIQVTALA